MSVGTSDSARRVSEAVFVLCLLPILTASFAVGVRTPFWSDARPLFLALGVATLAWWLAIALARQRCGDLRIVVVGAIALRLLGLIGSPDLSRAPEQELWHGRVLMSGASPYAFGPDSSELDVVRDEHAELHASFEGDFAMAPAPPLALFVAGAIGLAGDESERGALGLRIVAALCDLLLLWPLVVLLRRRGAPEQLCVVWAWCPLAVLEFAGSGQLDSLALLLLVAAFALLVVRGVRVRGARRRGMAGIALLAGAALVRPLAVCALPFVLRGRGAWKRTALFALVSVLACAPLVFLRGGLHGIGRWFEAVVAEPAHGAILYPIVEWVLARLFAFDGSMTDPRHLGRLVVLALWIVVGLRLFALRRGPIASTRAMIGAFLLLTPALHPWTMLWILPFAALEPRASWLWLVGAAPLLYAPLADYRGHGGWSARAEWLVFGVVPCFALFAYESRLAARSDAALRGARRHMRLRRARTT